MSQNTYVDRYVILRHERELVGALLNN
jgi:hypothetical protein